MRIGIVDADLLWAKGHLFPNLALMKLSTYWKGQGADVSLVCTQDDLNHLTEYDKVLASKVFTYTQVPDGVFDECKHITYGGTGFYFDKAKPLSDEIEHCMPDYSLYDEYLMSIADGQKDFDFSKFRRRYKLYIDYSIGFLTRGCFRHCPFCVNRASRRSRRHSPLSEFYDESKPRILLLDDNFFGCISWRELIEPVLETGKPYSFQQGLDIRLLDVDKCVMLASSNYDKHIIFAFDHLKDAPIIEEKLAMFRTFAPNTALLFYVLAGYPEGSVEDIESVFERIRILFKYNAMPFVMKYRGDGVTPYKEHEYSGIYTGVARWCNQVRFLLSMSFREFAQYDAKTKGTETVAFKAIKKFETEYPEIAKKYFDMKLSDFRV